MKQLLKKEFTFTALPLCYLFLLFSGMTMIPGYPIAMDSFSKPSRRPKRS